MPVSERYLSGATRERLKIMGGGGVRFLGQVESSYPLVLPVREVRFLLGTAPRRCQLRGADAKS